MVDLKSQKSAVSKFSTGITLPNLTFSTIETGIIFKRRTATDEVFDGIYADIMSLTLKPGTKISEAEIAKQYNVSRHPIRDAFTRLSNLGLILIRPQRATVVRKISLQEVSNARFLRMAIELEVARAACANRTEEHLVALDANLEAQTKTVKTGDFNEFQIFDIEFHRLLCISADKEFAFHSISQTKTQIDRLCTISLSHKDGFTQAYEDHIKIIDCLKSADVASIIEITRAHMSRLDTTIVKAKLQNEDYFTE